MGPQLPPGVPLKGYYVTVTRGDMKYVSNRPDDHVWDVTC